MDGIGSATTGRIDKGQPSMSAALKRRLLALETARPTGTKPRELPAIVDDDVTDAELEAIRKRTGRMVYRFKDDPLWDCFLG